MKLLDLFSGAGGLSLGFKNAGFKVAAAVDFDSVSLDTYGYNMPETLTVLADLSSLGPGEFSTRYGFDRGEFDGIIGGPPCQGFSLAGPRNFYDRRNTLFLRFRDYVNFFKPRFFLIENVPGLASLFGGQILDRIKREFYGIGYNVTSSILLASDYGVPQDRKRIFIIGATDYSFIFPTPVYSSISSGQQLLSDGNRKLTVRDAISDLPLLENSLGSEEMPYPSPPETEYQRFMRVDSDSIHNHIASNHFERTKEIISKVPPGNNYKSLPQELRNTRNYHVAWTRLSYDRPAPTIDTGHRHHFHPVANRVPTVRESARLQSFPDKFVFYGSKTSQYVQVGNAVPPILAWAIAQVIIRGS